MSFFSKNENFIRIKFHSDMKTMSSEEKVLHYNTHLKNETLKRLKEYFESTTEELNKVYANNESPNLFTLNYIELEKKTQDYIEIFNLLKNYEYETILYSIYFENLSKELLSALSQKLLDNKPPNFKDKFLIIDSLNKSGDLSKLILNEKLELTKNDWSEENINRNTIEKKLTEWIARKLVERDTDFEINMVLFHFAKLWKSKYSNPYNEIKGIVLLNDLISTLKNILPDLKVNLSGILIELNLIFDSLFFKVNLAPYLENEYTLRKSIKPGYDIKKKEFNSLLEESCKYLVNYEKLSNKELFKIYFDSNEKIQKLIFEIIKKRYSNGYIPNSLDINYFKGNYLQCINDSQKLIEYFTRINYFFEMKIY